MSYISRNWLPALKESGAWPLASLRQSFLNGSLTRLLDPDTTLRGKIVEFVGRGDFGLASGQKPDGAYERVWFQESVTSDEVAFESEVFLLTEAKAQALKAGVPAPAPGPEAAPPVQRPEPALEAESGPKPTPGSQTKTIRLVGAVPSELWNRLGTKLLRKLRSGSDLRVGVDFTVTVSAEVKPALEGELRQILQELRLSDALRLERGCTLRPASAVKVLGDETLRTIAWELVETVRNQGSRRGRCHLRLALRRSVWELEDPGPKLFRRTGNSGAPDWDLHFNHSPSIIVISEIYEDLPHFKII